MTAATSSRAGIGGGAPLLYRLHYTRWADRVLAFFWPPKRRQLRIAQAFLDHSAEDFIRALDQVCRDAALYGTTFVGPDGERIDPEEIEPSYLVDEDRRER